MYELKLRNHWQKSMTTDWKINYDTETDTSDVEKIKSRSKQNLEDEGSNMGFHKADTRRSINMS